MFRYSENFGRPWAKTKSSELKTESTLRFSFNVSWFRKVKSAEEGGDDKDAEETMRELKKLYAVQVLI